MDAYAHGECEVLPIRLIRFNFVVVVVVAIVLFLKWTTTTIYYYVGVHRRRPKTYNIYNIHSICIG